MKQTRKLSFYEVNPRYFKDYTGDGIGDLAGLDQKFDYFRFLGVDAIILQDVLSADELGKKASFTEVASTIGTIQDMTRLVAHANKNQQGLFIELNVGTIKENHAWFQSALKTSDQDFNHVVNFSQTKENDNLEYGYSDANHQYFVCDSKTQEIPLNWKSDQVLNHFLEVVAFWKNKGISGFVLKNFEYLADVEKKKMMSLETKREIYKLYKGIQNLDGHVVVIGKSDIIPIDESASYTNENEGKLFDYFINTQISKNGLDKRFGIDKVGKFSPRKLYKDILRLGNNNANILSFGSRHVGRVLSRWGNDGQYSREAAKALGMLLLLTKASSLIYYGDEIGMPNIGLTYIDEKYDAEISERQHIAYVAGISEREFMKAQILQNPINAQALMAWDDSVNGGFSLASKTISPIATSYKENNVRNQFSDESSILLFYKELNRIVTSSNFSKVLERGNFKVSMSISGVIKLSFKYKDKDLKVIVNTTDRVRPTVFMSKPGKVLLSSYWNKKYKHAPNKLEAYEAIIISRQPNEYIRETQSVKLINERERQEAMKKATQDNLLDQERLTQAKRVHGGTNER